MYNEYYNLRLKPFQISSDPRFLWFGEKHKEALAILRYGILDNKGFLLLTGDVGTGKTSLINALLQGLKEDILCVSVPDPNLERMDFFNYIASAFGINKEFQTKGGFLGAFRNFLLQANQEKKKVLLIIDESQLLSQDMLEEIRLLSNIEKAEAKLINIFFIGQNEFNEILNRTQNRALRQRMTLNYNLEPLNSEEVDAYICHRLKVAGTTETLFGPDAVQEIYLYSGGFPRRINILCDHALLSGFVKNQRVIDAKIVRECAKELKIPAYVKNRTVNDNYNDYYDEDETPKASANTPRGLGRQTEPDIRPDYEEPPVVKPTAPSGYQARSINRGRPPEPPPVQPAPRTFVPPPPPESPRRKPWIELILLAGFAVFAWYFMFPDHFIQTTSEIRYRIETAIHAFQGDGLPEKGPVSAPQKTPEVKPEIPAQGKRPVTTAPRTGTADQGETHSPSAPGIQNSTMNNSIQTEGVVVVPVRPDHRTLPESQSIQNNAPKDQIVPELQESSGAVTATSPSKPVEEKKPEAAISAARATAEDSVALPLPLLPKEPIIIRFKYNANDFNEEALKALGKFSKALVTHPEARITITGHTDALGSEEYNIRLSEFRANIVKSYLLGVGVKDNQMETIGAGGKYPIQSNDTAWGRAMNRRVEIMAVQ